MVTLSLTQIRENGTRTYNILADGTEVGFCQLRLIPSRSAEMPEGFENHIYYEVAPEYRGKGYATAALTLLLAEAKKLGLKEVILAADIDNLASQQVIIRNNGVLLDTQKGQSGFLHQKYSINLA
jgi:predicted acetyltransferase